MLHCELVSVAASASSSAWVRVARISTAWRAQVDQLLAVQFQEDMSRLVQHCGRRAPGGRQTLLVSATLTPKVPLPFAAAALLLASVPAAASWRSRPGLYRAENAAVCLALRIQQEKARVLLPWL